MNTTRLFRFTLVVAALIALAFLPLPASAQRGGGGHGGGGGGGFHGGGAGGFHGGSVGGGFSSGGHAYVGGGYRGGGYYGGYRGGYGYRGYGYGWRGGYGWGRNGYGWGYPRYGWGGWGWGFGFGWPYYYGYPYGYGYGYPYSSYSYPSYSCTEGYDCPPDNGYDGNGDDPPPPDGPPPSNIRPNTYNDPARPWRPSSAPPSAYDNGNSNTDNYLTSVTRAPVLSRDVITATPSSYRVVNTAAVQNAPLRPEILSAIRSLREMPPYVREREIETGRYSHFSDQEKNYLLNLKY